MFFSDKDFNETTFEGYYLLQIEKAFREDLVYFMIEEIGNVYFIVTSQVEALIKLSRDEESMQKLESTDPNFIDPELIRSQMYHIRKRIAKLKRESMIVVMLRIEDRDILNIEKAVDNVEERFGKIFKHNIAPNLSYRDAEQKIVHSVTITFEIRDDHVSQDS